MLMKYTKNILLLLIMLLFASCQSVEEVKEIQIPEEEAEAAITLLYDDTVKLTEENFAIKRGILYSLFPEELAEYESPLTRFDTLYSDASDELEKLLNGAVKAVIPLLEDYDYSIPSPAECLIEPNLFSSNRDGIISLVTPGIQEYINEHKGDFDTAYALLIFECSVLRANYENLEKVGFSKTLRSIGDFDYSAAVSFAAEALYEVLCQNEMTLRNTPLSLQSNPLYRYFWEEL